MEKMKMHSRDNVAVNVEAVGRLFPNALTEVLRDGKLVQAIDFDVLRQELAREIVEGREERYAFTWPDKRQAILAANAPINATLRPVVEDSVGRDGTAGAFDSENLYIEGDNLDVLKLLQETYLGKVKMIYIDPPYNTGNDAFVYDDDFAMENSEFKAANGLYDEDGNITYAFKKNPDSNGRFHTDWLNMIYPRLRVAKSLLADDGVIFISIDDNEVHNLRKVCDEIFGEGNFVSQIVWEKRYTRSNNSKKFTTLTEPLLCYSKNITSILEIKEKRSKKADSIYSNPDNDPRGAWTSVSYVNPATKEQRPNLSYPLFNPITETTVDHPTNAWKYEKATYEQHVREDRLYWGRTGENSYPRLKKFLSEMDGVMVPVDLWRQEDTGTTDQASKDIENLLGRKMFDFSKPKELVMRILSLMINGDEGKDALILDFFSGSATTAHAVMQLNAEDGGSRKFIMVQLPEVTDEKSEAHRAGYRNICEIGKERIRRAGAKIAAEAGEKAAELDLGFRCLRLDTSNMTDVYYTPEAVTQDGLFTQVDNVKADRTPEDLLFQTMLDLGILLSEPIAVEEIADKRVFNVADGFLLACFDRAVTDETVTAIAKRKPYYAVFRDASMADDSALTNFDQIFAAYSPATVRRVL